VLLGYLALYAIGLHVDAVRPLTLTLAAIAVFAVLLVLLSAARLGGPATARLVLTGAAALQAIALTRGPTTSDDVYRYIWDAKVQLHGIDPYRFVPQSPHLASLRDSLLFGSGPFCGYQIPGRGCTLINRPDVHTVYPPVAQAAFDLVRVLSFGGHGGTRALAVAAAVGVLAATALLLRNAQLRGASFWPVAVFAWSPIAVLDFGNNAHIDWVAIVLSILALQAGARGRPLLAGTLIGAAIATKIYPVLLLPTLLRRRAGRVVGAAFGVIALGYLPHVLAVGTGVIGYLPGYLREEGYGSGRRLLLLGAVLPGPFDLVAGFVIMAVATLWCLRHTDPDDPYANAALLMGVGFLVATPAFGWYAGLLLALAVLAGRLEWSLVAIAPMIAYLTRGEYSHAVDVVVYAVAAAVAGGVIVSRSRVSRPDARRSPGHLVQLAVDAGRLIRRR
jgi:hypothetical protein